MLDLREDGRLKRRAKKEREEATGCLSTRAPAEAMEPQKRREDAVRTKRLLQIMAAILVVGLLAGLAEAQPWRNWRGSGGWGVGGAYQRMYDPATVVTVVGEVASVEEVVSMPGMMAGIHLILKTAKGELPVHLGPAWYVERLDTAIEAGDKIVVRGSRVMVDGKPALIAAEVKKGDSVLVLRDEAGIPAWAGWRR